MTASTVSVEELRELVQRGQQVDLIDVRTPAEFEELHAEGARLVPLDRLDPKAVMAERQLPADAPLYVICRTGSRAKKACEALHAAGYSQAVCIEGGTLAWERAGLPVKRGKKAISLERQVRIAAGLLVLVGSALGFFVHPYFIGIAALIGAGLTFAGITDTCGMAMLLAKMPWNQAPRATTQATPAGATCTSR